MATFKEKVYTDTDNEIVLGLFKDGKPFEASQVTRAKLHCKDQATDTVTSFDSDVLAIFTFNSTAQVGDTSGVTVVKIMLGGAGLSAGSYSASLVLYYPDYSTNGVLWDTFFVEVEDLT